MRRLVLLAFLVVAVLPDDVTACAIDPEGVSVGGSCWFLGELGQSCDDVCDLRGLSYSEATRTFAGSDGTLANCEAVMTGLNVSYASSSDTPCGDGYGCMLTIANIVNRCTAFATTGDVSASVRRACACVRARPVPTLSTWSTAALITALFGFGLLTLRRRSRV